MSAQKYKINPDLSRIAPCIGLNKDELQDAEKQKVFSRTTRDAHRQMLSFFHFVPGAALRLHFTVSLLHHFDVPRTSTTQVLIVQSCLIKRNEAKKIQDLAEIAAICSIPLKASNSHARGVVIQ